MRRQRPSDSTSWQYSKLATRQLTPDGKYDAVDPTNRLVANELERRWNVALENVQRIEREMAASAALRSPPLDEQQKQQLMALGADLARAWSHSAATAATRKRILRACLDEIIVRKDGEVLDMVLRWQGGDHRH